MNKNLILETLKRASKMIAQEIQEKSADMSGTELYEEKFFIPSFNPERQYLNFEAGYVCKSSAGRVVKLLQPYDSTVYTQEPEELPAQWGFYWSKSPKDALPFISLATGAYMTGDCCTMDDKVYRSLMDNNTWSPNDYAQGWELVEE